MLYNTTIQLTPSEFHALTSNPFCTGNCTGECLPKSGLEQDLLEYIDESTEGRIYIGKLLELTPGGHLIWVKDPPTPQKLREDYFRLMEVPKKAELSNYVGSLLIAMRKFYFDEKSPDEYVFVDSLGDLLNAAVRSGFEGLMEEESNEDQEKAEIVPETDFEEEDTSDEESDEWDNSESETDPESESELEFMELF
jgi:hypothetical protein